jgi:hypothetical protein
MRIELEEHWPGFLKWFVLTIKSAKRSLWSIGSPKIPTIELSRSDKIPMRHRTEGGKTT